MYKVPPFKDKLRYKLRKCENDGNDDDDDDDDDGDGVDENECASADMCENGQCVNIDGSFRCLCETGYVLSPSGKQCLGMSV